MQIFIHHFLLSENARHGIMNRNEDIRDAIVQCRPDLIILDHIYLPPAVSYSKVPWIRCISSNPLVCLFDDDLPPGGSGYSLDDKRTAEWSLFKQIHRQLFYSRMFNSYLCNMGYAPYEREMVMPQTQLLTIYALPDEMNYTQIKAKELWFNIEAFNKDQVDHSTDLYQLMPVSFLIDSLDGQFSGKWIYLSMGTMGSANVDLMKRLVNVLGKTKHKYIVSKGPLHSEYELASNMWGDDYVPQIDIIKFVDLVISHGGHNTVTETMAQGKPMVVMPLFWDQFDNAQRLHQLELSVWLDPFEFTEWQLHSAISRLLGDNELNTRLRNIAIRIQSSCAHEKLCNKIENLLGKV